MNNPTPKYFVCNSHTSVPTFQTKEDRVFTIYLFDVRIGTVELVNNKWTSFNLAGKKVSARRGGWWNSTELLVERELNAYITKNGWHAYSAKRAEYRSRMC